MRPVGRLIRNIKEKANVRHDSISNRKQSHSLAAALYNFGREKLSSRWLLVDTNSFSLPKLLMVADPVMDSAKCCIIGALQTPTSLCSSLAVSM
jgi:hypothetical protein